MTVTRISKNKFEENLTNSNKDTLRRCVLKNNNLPFSENDIGKIKYGFYIAKKIKNETADLYLNKDGLNIHCNDMFKTFCEALECIISYEASKSI